MRRIAAHVKRKMLTMAEHLFTSSTEEPRYPPLFILGLPRSGTTVLYQYIVHRCEVAYFTNGVEEHYYAPAATTWLRYKRHGAYVSLDFRSDYGKVPGPNAPHEAGVFWGQFFDFHEYARYEGLQPGDEQCIRRTVAAVERIHGHKPFVTKNVKHLLRLTVLPKVFPKAHFLVTERRLEDVALSLLRGRYANLGRADGWLSARPPGWQDIDHLPPARQIPRQLVGLQQKMERDLAVLPQRRVHRIRYEEFCTHPEGVIDHLVRLEGYQRRTTRAVESFEQSTNTPRTEEEEELVAALRDLRRETV